MAGDLTSGLAASQKVFAINELLDLILSFCQPKLLLTTLPAVHSSWRDTIACSLWIQRVLFKRPLDGTLSDNVGICHAWGCDQADIDAFIEASRRRRDRHIDALILHPFLGSNFNTERSLILKRPFRKSMLFCRCRLSTNQYLSGSVANTTTTSATAAGPDSAPASWHKAFVSQPPATRVYIRLAPDLTSLERGWYAAIDGDDGIDWYRCPEVADAEGVTLAMVLRTITSYRRVYEHSEPSKFEVVWLGFDFT